jgi:hypothetical protein
MAKLPKVRVPAIATGIARWACELGGVGLISGGLWWRVDPLFGLIAGGVYLLVAAGTGGKGEG